MSQTSIPASFSALCAPHSCTITRPDDLLIHHPGCSPSAGFTPAASWVAHVLQHFSTGRPQAPLIQPTVRTQKIANDYGQSHTDKRPYPARVKLPCQLSIISTGFIRHGAMIPSSAPTHCSLPDERRARWQMDSTPRYSSQSVAPIAFRGRPLADDPTRL
jgi:hypothetical protein